MAHPEGDPFLCQHRGMLLSSSLPGQPAPAYNSEADSKPMQHRWQNLQKRACLLDQRAARLSER